MQLKSGDRERVLRALRVSLLVSLSCCGSGPRDVVESVGGLKVLVLCTSAHRDIVAARHGQHVHGPHVLDKYVSVQLPHQQV